MLSQHQLLRMILSRRSSPGRAALAILLAIPLSGCDPANPAASATPISQALAPALVAPPPQQAPAPPPPPQASPQQERVQALIQQVEKAYSLGEAAYKRGNLPEAKSNFDNAVDLMSSSGIDIKSTPALQRQCD